jgi:hypothetical protein
VGFIAAARRLSLLFLSLLRPSWLRAPAAPDLLPFNIAAPPAATSPAPSTGSSRLPSPITTLLLSVSQSLVTRHLAFEFDHSTTLLFVCLEKANPKAWPNYHKNPSSSLASLLRVIRPASSSAAPSFDWYIYPV